MMQNNKEKGDLNLRKKVILLIIIFLIAGLFSFITYNVIMRKVLYNTAHEEIIYKYAEEYDVDAMLIFAIIKNESNFDKEIISNKNAIGLMQLLETTAEEIGLELGLDNIDLKDEETNINIGTKYFSYLMNKYSENYMLSLAAYNAGQGNVDKWIEQGIITKDGDNLENIPFKETNMYVRKVSRDYEIYKKLYR